MLPRRIFSRHAGAIMGIALAMAIVPEIANTENNSTRSPVSSSIAEIINRVFNGQDLA